MGVGAGELAWGSGQTLLFLPEGPVSLPSSALCGRGLGTSPGWAVSLHVFNRSLPQEEEEAEHPTSLYFSG